MNRLKTLVLLSTLTALLLWAGHAMAGQGGLVLALMFAVVMNFGALLVVRQDRVADVRRA
jgi:heat shock protein HtpX